MHFINLSFNFLFRKFITLDGESLRGKIKRNTSKRNQRQRAKCDVNDKWESIRYYDVVYIHIWCVCMIILKIFFYLFSFKNIGDLVIYFYLKNQFFMSGRKDFRIKHFFFEDFLASLPNTPNGIFCSSVLYNNIIYLMLYLDIASFSLISQGWKICLREPNFDLNIGQGHNIIFLINGSKLWTFTNNSFSTFI